MNKIDSNQTGLRYAEETTPGVVAADAVWKPLEPNSYSDFGATTKSTARAPMSPSRQRQKGVVTDLDAAAGFNTDLTSDNLYDFFQGFFFADWRKKHNLTPSAVTAAQYTVAANGTNFKPNDLVGAAGFAVAGNNGLHLVTASAANAVTANGLVVEAAPPAGAIIRRVGHQFAAGDAKITVTNGVAALEATAKNLTELGLIAGEWVYIGGDAAPSAFATAENNGFARVAAIAAQKITFDKTSKVMVADVGAAKTVQVFFGDVLKNESDPSLIKTRSYQFERSLGGAGYEYAPGSFPNELAIKLTQGDKVTADLSFVSMDTVPQVAAKEGSRPAIATSSTAFNTSSDFSRLRLEKTDATGLATFLTEASITINNGVTPVKALGRMGAVDTTAGDFAVSGSVTALFTDIETIKAVRANVDATMDFALVTRNAGVLLDMPLIALGNGRLNVEKDQPITIPLSQEAAAHATLNHTLLISNFSYLPTVAEG